MKIALGLLVLLASFSTFSNTKACKNLTKCINHVSKLTGKAYVYNKDLKGSVTTTSNFKINKGNAEYFLSMALNQNGYTRVPLKDKDGYQIINTRDIRYTPTKIYFAGKDKLPHNYDYIMLIIDLKGAKSSEITRSFRPFMSRYGRILDIRQTNRIIIQDTAINAKRLLKLVRSIDAPLTSKQKEQKEDEQEHRRELEKLRAKSGTDVQRQLLELSMQINKLNYKQQQGFSFGMKNKHRKKK